MPLDVDRLADALFAGTKALIAKELAPIVAASAELRQENAALVARVAEIEARDIVAELRPSLDSIRAAVDALPEPPDLSDFVTRDAMAEAVSAAVAGMEAPALSDVPELVDAAVRAAVEALPPVPEMPDVSMFATKEDLAALNERFAAIEASIPAAPDLDGFATKAEVAEVRSAIPEPLEIPPPPDLSGFATREDIDAALSAIPEPDLSGFAMKADVDEVRAAIPAPVDPPAPVDLSGFATKDDVAAAVAAIHLPEVIHGKDGVGIAEAKLNADGELIIKRTDGETFNVGKVRGEDGLGFDDMSVEWDGEREMSLVFSRDGRTEVTRMTMPTIVYRGVWREGRYQAGDAITWAGSLFIARRDTTDKPETSDAWTLAAKRGRDGKPTK